MGEDRTALLGLPATAAASTRREREEEKALFFVSLLFHDEGADLIKIIVYITG